MVTVPLDYGAAPRCGSAAIWTGDARCSRLMQREPRRLPGRPPDKGWSGPVISDPDTRRRRGAAQQLFQVLRLIARDGRLIVELPATQAAALVTNGPAIAV